MPNRTFSLSEEASAKLDRMAEQEQRTFTTILNRLIMQAPKQEATRPAKGDGE